MLRTKGESEWEEDEKEYEWREQNRERKGKGDCEDVYIYEIGKARMKTGKTIN